MLYTGIALVSGVGILAALIRGGKFFSITQLFKKYAIGKTVKVCKKLSRQEKVEVAMTNTSLWWAKFSQKISKGLNNLFNLNPLMDIGTAQLCKKTAEKTGLSKLKFRPFEGIKSFFTGQARKLTFSKYKAPQKDLQIFKNNIQNAIQEIEKLNIDKAIKSKNILKLKQLLKMSDQEMQSIIKNFDSRFDDTVTTLNYYAKDRFLDTFLNNDGARSIKKFNELSDELGVFVPEKIMRGDKKRIFSDLEYSKKLLSNNVLDLHKTLIQRIDDVFFSDILKNQDTRKAYIQIRDMIGQLKDPKTAGFRSRRGAKAQLLRELRKAKKLDSLSAEKIKALDDMIQLIRTDKRGAVEEAVSICKIIRSSNPELYSTLVANRNAFQRSLNKAIGFETGKNYERLLDFSLDAIPRDVLTQMAGLGTIGWIIADNKKTKEERISVSLKEGVPLIGGLAVSALCNLRMVATGVNAILLGVASRLIFKQLGNASDKKYQNYLLNKHA